MTSLFEQYKQFKEKKNEFVVNETKIALEKITGSPQALVTVLGILSLFLSVELLINLYFSWVFKEGTGSMLVSYALLTFSFYIHRSIANWSLFSVLHYANKLEEK